MRQRAPRIGRGEEEFVGIDEEHPLVVPQLADEGQRVIEYLELDVAGVADRGLVLDQPDGAGVGQQIEEVVRTIVVVVLVDEDGIDPEDAVMRQPLDDVDALVADRGQHGEATGGRDVGEPDVVHGLEQRPVGGRGRQPVEPGVDQRGDACLGQHRGVVRPTGPRLQLDEVVEVQRVVLVEDEPDVVERPVLEDEVEDVVDDQGVQILGMEDAPEPITQGGPLRRMEPGVAQGAQVWRMHVHRVILGPAADDRRGGGVGR